MKENRALLVELFQRALALSARERESLLAELQRGKPALARELEELLAQDERGGPLASRAQAKASLIDSLVHELERGDAPGPDPPSSLVLEKLAARTPAASRYSVQGEVARGGMGAILEVWDEDIGRSLAMKVALAQAREEPNAETPQLDARALARFLEEAQVTGQLDHPGIVPVHELGLDREGRVYFTMRLVKGRDLGEILELVRRGDEGWTQTRALGVLLKVCEAMSYAHSNGVVHRDLKPANVMVGRFGEVYVMDWGLARARGRRAAGSSGEHAERTVADGAPGSKGLLATRAGAILGTPSYMPPEQAAGRLAEVDERSDVYALGAMLYELLSGCMPYCEAGGHAEPFALLARVLAGPPAPLRALAPRTPAELVAICEQAMSRDPRARYADMGALGEDLRAFLEGRVVHAYETGAWAEARKWIERNRALAGAIAAGLVALVAGLTASLILKAQSDHNAALATEREVQANANFELAEKRRSESETRRGEVLRLSALQDLEDLVARAGDLWPAHPENAKRCEEWIRDARSLLGELPVHRAKRDELRAKALPRTEEERQAERARHPDFAELVRVEGQLASGRRALLVRRDGVEPELPAVDWSLYPADAPALNGLAWERVQPGRQLFGEEALGLALARRAAELAPRDADILDTLACACFAVGLDDEALNAASAALEEAGEERAATFQENLAKLEEAVTARNGDAGWKDSAAELSRLEARRLELAPTLDERREWSFPEEERQGRWWEKQLTKLIQGLVDLEAGLLSEDGVTVAHGWSVPKRLEFARTVAESTQSGAEANRRWAQAIASIRDREECPQYDGLVLAPQLGLLPIGRDPESGLWEFAHAQTGVPAERGPDEKLLLSETTGLVFVLLPGGRSSLGTQRRDPGAPNYDPEAMAQEGPVHSVTLSPFFLSKYEMTQGQWLRVAGENPSLYGAHHWPTSNRSARRADLLHPVEQVKWGQCVEVCRRMDLVLPSEAQWEYAARGGTTTPWWTGPDPTELASAANLADGWARRNGGPPGWPYEEWNDGNSVHAHVGSLRANPFGLFDVHGNVWEWCLDRYDDGFYARIHARDPVADDPRFTSRVNRGGSFDDSAIYARVTMRFHASPELAAASLGLRPARAVTP